MLLNAVDLQAQTTENGIYANYGVFVCVFVGGEENGVACAALKTFVF